MFMGVVQILPPRQLKYQRSFSKDLLGMWRSLVAHTHGVRGVAGSNPVIPTIKPPKPLYIKGLFFH